jgi:spore coat protein U-like protein
LIHSTDLKIRVISNRNRKVSRIGPYNSDMHMIRNRLSILAMEVFAIVGIAKAGTTTSNLTVTASVAAGCQISSIGNMNFGVYDPLSPAPNDSSGNVVYRCVKGTSFKTYITGTRSMSASGSTLSFQLYNDSGRTTAYPNNNSGGSTTATSNVPVTQNVYGRINAGQDVSPASYSTNLVVTVEY